MKCWDIWKEFVFYAVDFTQFAQKCVRESGGDKGKAQELRL